MVQLNLLTSERAGPGKATPAPGPAALPARWTARYSCMRGGFYFRFYWQQQDRAGKWQTRHLHIRGGNAESTAAIANRAAVDNAIAAGATVAEIKALIGSQCRKTGNYKRESK